MKYFTNCFLIIFCLQICLGSCENNVSVAFVDEQVEKLNLCSRKSFYDIPELISVLEVIELPSMEDYYEGYGIKMNYSTGDMKLFGAKNFVIDQVSLSKTDLTASLDFHIPQLQLTSDNYYLIGKALFYALSGNGFMNIAFQNVRLGIAMHLVRKGENAELKRVTLEFEVNKIKINLENSSWPINRLLNSIVMRVLDDYHDTIVISFEEKLKTFLNKYANTSSVEEILDLIEPVECLINKRKARELHKSNTLFVETCENCIET